MIFEQGRGGLQAVELDALGRVVELDVGEAVKDGAVGREHQRDGAGRLVEGGTLTAAARLSPSSRGKEWLERLTD